MAKFLVGGVVVEGAEALLDPVTAALYPYDKLDEFFALAPLQQDPARIRSVRHPSARPGGMAEQPPAERKAVAGGIAPLALTRPRRWRWFLQRRLPSSSCTASSPRACSRSAPLTLDALRAALRAPLNALLAGNSAVIGLLAAAASLLIALPIAYWLRYAAGRWRRSAVHHHRLDVRELPRADLRLAHDPGRKRRPQRRRCRRSALVDALGRSCSTTASVTVALVHIFLPCVVLVLYAGFRPLTPALLEAAQDLGAGAVQRWRRIFCR